MSCRYFTFGNYENQFSITHCLKIWLLPLWISFSGLIAKYLDNYLTRNWWYLLLFQPVATSRSALTDVRSPAALIQSKRRRQFCTPPPSSNPNPPPSRLLPTIARATIIIYRRQHHHHTTVPESTAITITLNPYPIAPILQQNNYKSPWFWIGFLPPWRRKVYVTIMAMPDCWLGARHFPKWVWGKWWAEKRN